MKIIDKTPLVDEKGNLGFTERIQGMFKFGLNWPYELQAQKVIVTFFDRNLEKGYTLLRNIRLGQSDIMIPLILLGPAGIFVIQITYLRGKYEAKGDSWNVESGNQYKPAPVNLIQRTARMARALQVFIERQGVKLPVNVEPVLIAADPGLHIESVKPSIKVMMIDGIKSFVSGLGTSHPVLNAHSVLEFVDRILEPRQPKKDPVRPTAPASTPRTASKQGSPPVAAPDGQNVSRARAIFNASEEAKPFNPSDFEFAIEAEPDLQASQATPREPASATSLPAPRQKTRRIFGMTSIQLVILAAIALILICVLVVGIGYVIPLLT